MVVGASIRARDVVTWMNVVKWGFPLGSFRDKTQDEELLGRNRGSIIRIPKQLVEIFREQSKTAISVIWLGSATEIIVYNAPTCTNGGQRLAEPTGKGSQRQTVAH